VGIKEMTRLARAAQIAIFSAKKLAEALLIFWAAATLVFFLLDALPGDPAAVLLARSGASGSQVEAMRREMGLDRPLLVRYASFISGVSRGDFGRSIFTGRKVSLLIIDRFRYTLELATWAMLVALLVAFSLGLAAAINQGRWIDRVIQLFIALTSSVPVYWSGLLQAIFMPFILVKHLVQLLMDLIGEQNKDI
jgi:peptide/nickel transport system permease protein